MLMDPFWTSLCFNWNSYLKINNNRCYCWDGCCLWNKWLHENKLEGQRSCPLGENVHFPLKNKGRRPYVHNGRGVVGKGNGTCRVTTAKQSQRQSVKEIVCVPFLHTVLWEYFILSIKGLSLGVIFISQ